MNTTTKKIFYLIMMTGMIFADCYAGEGQGPETVYGPHLPPGNNQATVYHQPGGYGQYATSNINPSGSLQPIYVAPDIYQSQLLAQHKQDQLRRQEEERQATEVTLNLLVEEQEAIKEQIAKDRELAEKFSNAHSEDFPHQQSPTQNNAPAAYSNSSGGGRDTSATYNNSTYVLQSFFKTISTQLSRTTKNSSLFVLRCGNTYQDIYQEVNKNSALLDIALFNTYKKGMVANNVNSSRFGLSIGDLILVENKQSGDTNSTNWSLSINRDECAALLAVGIALKYGILQTCLHATGVALPCMVAVPVMVGGAFVVPIVMTIGTSLVVIVGGAAALLAGGLAVCAGGVAVAGGMILLPFSPLLMLLWAASRR